DGPGGDGGALFGRQAHPVLFGGDEACVVDGGAVVQEGEVAVGQGGVVGEGDEILQVAACGDQGALDLPRLGDAREADLWAGRRRGGGFQPGDENRQVAEDLQQFGIGGVHVGGQHDDRSEEHTSELQSRENHE